MEAGSVDQSGNYVFDSESTILRSTGSRSICRWSTIGDTNTMVSLWNYSSKDQDFILTVFYRNAGRWELPLHLAASESRELDIASLIRTGVTDRFGRVIPPSITEGSAMLSSVSGYYAPIEVATSVSTFNVRNGTCTNVCGYCNGVTSGRVDPPSLSLVPGETSQVKGILSYNTGEQRDVTSVATWSSNNTSIATVSSMGLVAAASGNETYGNASIKFMVYNYPYGAGYICMGNQLNCPYANFGGTTSVTVDVPSSLSVDSKVSNYALNENSCGTGQAGWYTVYKRTVKGHAPIARANIHVTESIAPVGDPLDAFQNGIKTGDAYTSSDGTVQDTVSFCSPSCPASQATTYAQQSVQGALNGTSYNLGNYSANFTCQGNSLQ